MKKIIIIGLFIFGVNAFADCEFEIEKIHLNVRLNLISEEINDKDTFLLSLNDILDSCKKTKKLKCSMSKHLKEICSATEYFLIQRDKVKFYL